jgi:hypothetical protein
MTEPSCGSVQANAKRALYSLEETRASSNGQRTSAKKKRAKPKLQISWIPQSQQTNFFSQFSYTCSAAMIFNFGIFLKYTVFRVVTLTPFAKAIATINVLIIVFAVAIFPMPD